MADRESGEILESGLHGEIKRFIKQTSIPYYPAPHRRGSRATSWDPPGSLDIRATEMARGERRWRNMHFLIASSPILSAIIFSTLTHSTNQSIFIEHFPIPRSD